jgi:arsenate reductase (glutaredoxin)
VSAGVIYHNPRCSKSRASLEILREAGVDVAVVEYLEDPPTVAALDELCDLLEMEPVDLVRTGEKRFAELELGQGPDRSRREWLKILAANPILIERPIVRIGDAVVIGRPPQNVRTILP